MKRFSFFAIVAALVMTGCDVVHNNRYRAGLGVDWKVAKHHKLEFGAPILTVGYRYSF